MAEALDQRDFFISFNSVDQPFAEAIDAALRADGFTTFYHPRDLGPGGNIPMWMDDALMNSVQTLALYSPDYTKDKAVYSKAERYASWWQDPEGSKRKLIPILLRETTFTPLMAMISRIEVTGLPPNEAAARVLKRLKAAEETAQRDSSRLGSALPKIFHAAYRPNPNFTGRFEALDSLQRSLRNGTNAAVTAVAGMGGVGKTTLAAEYCHRFGARYAGVWWIRAEQEPVMLGDLQTLGQRLNIVSTGNIEADARACLDHLATLTQPWLLVYDNAPNPDAVRKWLPTGAVRCVVTSRYTEFGDIAPVTRLDQWSDEVTIDYLLTRTGRDDQTGATRLAKRLGGLPLASEQAAVYLRPRSSITFDDYATDIALLIKQPRPPGTKGDYPDTVYAAFLKTLDTLAETEEGKMAVDVLRLCAFLSPDGVELWLLTIDESVKALPAPLTTVMANKFVRGDVLAALSSFSILRQEDSPAGPVLIFHRLLLEIARDWMGEEARTLWGGTALLLVSNALPSKVSNPSNWSICASLMPHVAAIEAHAPIMEEAHRILGRVLSQACVYLAIRGDREGALALAEKSVALMRSIKKEDPRGFATCLNNLGRRYTDLERLKEAEATFREVLEVEEPLLELNDPSRAITISNLGGVLKRQGQFAEAEPLFLRAAELMKAAWGEDSAEHATLLGNLDSLYDDWAEQSGDISKRRTAEHYSIKALTVTLTTSGARHQSTAVRHYNLAVLKRRLEYWSDAVAEAELAVAIMLSLDLLQNRWMSSMIGNLLDCWEQAGQSEKAARLQNGDISDLLTPIAEIEEEHHAWVAKAPNTRHFGPPSPFEAK